MYVLLIFPLVKVLLLTEVSDPLAYLTAKSQGMTEEAQSILDTCGLTEDQINLPSAQAKIEVPRPIVPTYKSNWPVKEPIHSSFTKELLQRADEAEAQAAAEAAAEEEAEEEEEEEEEIEQAEEELDAPEDGAEEKDGAENGVEEEEEGEEEEEIVEESAEEDEYYF